MKPTPVVPRSSIRPGDEESTIEASNAHPSANHPPEAPRDDGLPNAGLVMRPVVWPVAAGFLLLPVPAHAHLVTTGLGPLYDGISHLFLSFEDLLPLIALSLLAGLNGPGAGRLALFVVPAAWLLGGLAGFAAGSPLLPGTVTAASFLILGGLTAADRRLPANGLTALASALGLLHGWLNGAGIAEAGREALGLVGIVSAVFVVVTLLAAFVVWLRPPWTRIAIRVAGSWIAAIGLLLLGWGLRPTP
jgi:urease accessory protein